MTVEPAGEHSQRLQKIIAAAGIVSRRKAEELIAQGRVQVNGQTVTELGTKADPARDHIRVDGKLLHGAERPRYYLLNKPRGYITTASDPENRPTVIDLIPGSERVFPVGRLDYASEGLLLMTNDGALANALTSAAAHVEKAYLVKISGNPSASAIDQLRHGVMIDRSSQIRRPGAAPRRDEGRVMTAPARIRLIREGENPWYEMVLVEGRNREIRKMFEEIGHHAEKIRRVGYGPLVLDVEPGSYRELSREEINALRRAASSRGAAKTADGDKAARKVRAPRQRARPSSEKPARHPGRPRSKQGR